MQRMNKYGDKRSLWQIPLEDLKALSLPPLKRSDSGSGDVAHNQLYQFLGKIKSKKNLMDKAPF